jgi:MoaA/NifB/PqqE/SkfB family radical SAM enzyme
MTLTSLHFLLTYQCVSECSHCFVFGSPFSSGVWTIKSLQKALDNAQTLETIDSICFEGGEPFLYYPILLAGLKEAKKRDYYLGVVSYPYWAQTVEDAKQWLQPIAEIGIGGLSVSGDCFHGDEVDYKYQNNAIRAAKELGIHIGLLAVDEQPSDDQPTVAGEKVSPGTVMYRGRAAVKLAPEVTAPRYAPETLTECPYENLTAPGRVHVDPFGNLHICQGIIIGNILNQPLSEIVRQFAPTKNPILGTLIAGGPAALVKQFNLPCEGTYADACELCYRAREQLRSQFPDILGPDQMYGEF